ncbi:MAG TPA: hypothetical protein VHW23_16395 [Kofleriaceae bacterium]|nr:hypothetical protein [Kofleriaceae bacterium]
MMLALVAAACAGRASPSAPAPDALPPFAAARWVPARPLYVLASPSVAQAQRAARDAIELLAAVTGHDLGDAMRASMALFGVDALHPDPIAAIGIDPGGGWALFGGEPGSPGALSPTMIVHLAAPGQLAAFLDRLRERGLATRSVSADHTEVVSAALPDGITVSWAVDADWLWVHVALPGEADSEVRWFTASHGRHDAAWTGGWAWAQHVAGAAASVVGVLELHGALARAVARMPDALACAKLAGSVDRVSLAVEGDDHHVAARLALDVGSTERLRALVLPPPSGWDATGRTAALAAQWNLDLAGARPLAGPCLTALGAPLDLTAQTGVRAGRAMLVGFDPDALSGTGAIALDLTSPAYLEHQLDRIPLRGTLERSRTFGPYRGHAISIPFRATIEYVLEPRLAIAAFGDGLLARLVAPAAAPAPVPIVAIDVAPPAMSAHAWEALIDALAERGWGASGAGRSARPLVAHLMGWRDAHLAITADGGELVVTVAGDRR